MSRTVGTLFALLWISLFAFAAAQLPEFVVQYAQRLGGATDEVASYLRRFDEGASRAGYARNAAIDQLLKNPDRLVYEQGVVARSQVERFERLTKQQAALGNGVTLGGIYYLLTDYDAPLFQKTLGSYVIGISFSAVGVSFAFLGGLVGAGILLLGAGLMRRRVHALEA